MMQATRYEIRAGVYYDSVILMQLQKSLAAEPGVVDAGVVMATPANRDLLVSSGFDLADIKAKADDMLIIVKAEDETAAVQAIGQVDNLLKRRPSAASADFRPRSLSSAANNLPDAEWVLISVPGRYAAGVAEDALNLGKNVFLYSDNVSIEEEINLKEQAREKGLLVMGPDCGTAIINGVGLGFANRVRRGSVGLVAASGTGLQAVTAGIHNLGGGISQAIGTGGRDLKAEVGGITTLQGLDLLNRDEQTKVIVLISKPMDTAVAAKVILAAQESEKPVILNLLGYPPPAPQVGNLFFAANLHEAAALAVELEQGKQVRLLSDKRESGYLRGLFSGGTLAYEALLGLQPFLKPLFSNIPLLPEQQLANVMVSQGHTILDLGEDEFTQGRLHPMMDNDLRLRRLRQEALDPEVGFILLDIVLGEGAHPDPAAELAPAIAAIKNQRDIEIMVILLGTDADPQEVDSQLERFSQAGARIVRETNEAVAAISRELRPAYVYDYPRVPLSYLGEKMAAINVGVESFYDSVKAQGAGAVHVDWRPPASGKDDLMAILAKMKKL